MKKCIWLLAVLASVSCGGALKGASPFPGKPNLPLPLPAGGVAFDLVVCRGPIADNYCDGPAGATFTISQIADKPDPPRVQDGDGDGYLYVPLIPSTWTLIQIDVTAPGFEPFRATAQTADLLATNAKGEHNFVGTMTSSHVDPASFSEAQIRAVRADLDGVYIDEIKPQCPVDPQTGIRCVADNGATPRGLVAGALFTANYRIYTDAQRQVIRDVLTGKRPDARGITHHYTHMAISVFCRPDVPDYHGVFPPCGQAAKVSANDALHELYDAGLIPIAFIMHDDEPDDLTTPLSVSGVVDPALIRIAVPFWEHTEVACATVKVHQAFPNALVYYHNPTSADAPYGDACFGSGVYPGAGAVYSWLVQQLGGRFAGIMLQTSELDVPSLIGRIADFTASFSNGPRSGRVGAGWPPGLDVVHFEDIGSTYNNFWGGGDEAATLARLNQINQYVSTPLCEDGNTRAVVPSSAWCSTLAGFGSGGSVR